MSSTENHVFFFLNACLPPPQKDGRFYPFSTPWLRLASTRAEFEQTATGLLTKLEKGLQSAQEAPFFDGKSREWIATSQQNTFWSCFCEQRSSTLPYSSGVFFFLLATKLTELFLLLPLTMFLLRKLQIWKDFLHKQLIEGLGYGSGICSSFLRTILWVDPGSSTKNMGKVLQLMDHQQLPHLTCKVRKSPRLEVIPALFVVLFVA